MKTSFNIVFTILVAACIYSSCDTIELDPPNDQLSSISVFSDEASIESTIVGLYSTFMQNPTVLSGGQQSIPILTGLSSDELTNFSTSPDQSQFYANTLQSDNTILNQSLWQESYKFIYHANAILEGLESNSFSLNPDFLRVKKGEVLFLRSYCYFHLMNLFGNVPLVLTTDYETNRLLPSASQQQLFEQMESDLLEAADLMPENFNAWSGERTRATKWAAKALLARLYLYNENWEQAFDQALSVVDDSSDFDLLTDLNGVFLANSREAILQFQPVVPNYNTWEGLNYILSFLPPFNVTLSKDLVSQFQADDLRLSSWVSSASSNSEIYYYPFKYKIKFGSPVLEYSMVIRYAEMFLIMAEASAELGDLDISLNYLNRIVQRAGMEPLEDINDKEELLDLISQQRIYEFFSEGHRWYDLKRTKRANDILPALKSNWDENDILYPIPLDEILKNPNLDQNPGY